MSECPKLSVIIPCRNDVRTLGTLLQQLEEQENIEVIVTSPAADQALSERCHRANARLCVADKPRGARLKAAAAVARSQHLWFLHADTQLEHGAVETVIATFADGAIGGYFRFRFAGPSTFVKRLLEMGVALRCRCGGIPYGDQAIFVTSEIYQTVGGHEALSLFDEFRLVRRLKTDGRFRALAMAVRVDPARWERNGYATHVIKNRLMSFAYQIGVSPYKLAEWYYK